MYKIKIPVDHYPIYDKIRKWCRDNYGPGYYINIDEHGKKIRKYRWRSGFDIDFINGKLQRYIVMFFEKEEHSTWFTIRWLTK
jgi:hypothetical protein